MVVLSAVSTHPHARPVPLPASVGDSYSSLGHWLHLLRVPRLPFRESAVLAELWVVTSAELPQSRSEGRPKYPDSGSEVVVVVAVEEVVVVHPPVQLPLYHLYPYDLYLYGFLV